MDGKGPREVSNPTSYGKRSAQGSAQQVLNVSNNGDVSLSPGSASRVWPSSQQFFPLHAARTSWVPTRACCPFRPSAPLRKADPKLLIKQLAPSLTSASICSTPSPYWACWGSPHPVPPACLSPSAWQPCPPAHWLCLKCYLLPANLPNFPPPLSSTYPAHL